MPVPIQLVVGLGNPGARYEHTRHNAGFRFVEAVAGDAGAAFRPVARFQAEACEARAGSHRVRLLKPQTFMNHSGRAVAACARYYRYLPEEILVVHDEIDLPAGVARLKRGGGHGGHNGLRDIILQLGSTDFHRLRLGVGHPGTSGEVVAYVLSMAPREQDELMRQSLENALEVLPKVLAGEIAKAMNALHRKPPPPDAAAPAAQ